MRKAIRCCCAWLAVCCAVVFAALVYWDMAIPDQFQVVAGSRLTMNGPITVTETAPNLSDNTHSEIPAASLAVGSRYTASLQLFGVFPIKTVAVHVVDPIAVIPCGMPFGIKLFTEGVLVVGMNDIDTSAGACNPAASAGMKVGDVILSINGQTVTDTASAARLFENAGGAAVCCRVRRDGVTFDVSFRCLKSVTENRYKAGLWIRDSAAGIGTMTFYDPSTGVFAGLGHAVCDVDTGETLPIASGEAVPARIFDLKRGLSGDPGELLGGFETGRYGSLAINNETGVYGVADTPLFGQAVPVAMRQQVQTGYAQILTTIAGCEPALYDVRIDQVSLRTLRNCMQDFFEDGPKRDRRLWLGDLRLQALTNSVTYRNFDLVKRCLYLFAGTANEQG